MQSVRDQRTNPGSKDAVTADSTAGSSTNSLPSISLPKGGGAIKGIGEKFAANPVTGTGSLSVPIFTSPGRSNFGPQLSLSYDSGAGNGPFGLGWNLSSPSITRKTDKGLPKYEDADESDVFILSGAEDLVPVLQADGTRFVDSSSAPAFKIHRYRPRVEGLFARIERWTNVNTGEIHWRSITRDNITTLYGKDHASRIFDPADPTPAHPTRVFSWLICQSYDDKGNAIIYDYEDENEDNVDLTQANERNRIRTANRYLKRIRYGNRMPNRDPTTWQVNDPAQLENDTWMFEVVFDYGEGHYAEESPPDEEGRIFAQVQLNPPDGAQWPVRQDSFSTYRAGFEVRTYRLCRRVLMFHHFPQELGIEDCLVRSTEFSYAESPVLSFISSVTQSGYVHQPLPNQPNRYLKKSMPSLELEYSQIPSPEELIQRPILEVDAESLENLPVGLDGSSYQWMDLDGEGTSGILTEQADGWYYKRNLSANNQLLENGNQITLARFGLAELVASKPVSGLGAGAQFLDLAGDGQVDLVQMEASLRGFYEHTDDATWAPFQPFVSWPDLNTRNPDLRFVDLTGDGHADILITEGDALTWYPSLGEEGFAPAVRLSLAIDEEKSPRLIFSDGLQSIYTADLSGDGLSDLVRIRNGEVCYWPNLGYGRFGAKVTMDHAPWFDTSDQFDQRYIRLADTDGSGTTDILYLGTDSVQIYFNQSGNRWSDAVVLPQFPPRESVSAIQAVDLLGNGTACLVWSSPMPDAVCRPMRYLALIEEKPHLLKGVRNNLGGETKVHYAPSTRFYLDDKRDGRPWITRLPFPVHVVERVETYDRVSGNRFVSRYKYHHGYFDGPEREFRGFGMVEQWDTEEIGSVSNNEISSAATNLDAASFVPPIHTKTWFHTGAYLGRDRVTNYFAGLIDEEDTGEYYREPNSIDQEAKKFLLDDTVLPDDLTIDEEREACRALKGAMLRQEVYGLDGTDKAQHPYTVTEQNFTIQRLQPRGVNRHAVFFTHAREALNYHYERNPNDPRISHAITLETDEYGNVLKSVAIGYGRKQSSLPELSEQTKTLITYTESSVTNSIDDPDAYRTPLPSEVRTYELHADPNTEGYTPTGENGFFQFDNFVQNVSSDGEIPYEEALTGDKTRRLIECVRTLYRNDDLSGLLPLGDLQPLALPGQTYKLAITPGLLAKFYKRKLGAKPEENLLPDPALVLGGKGDDQGGYIDLDANGRWWIPSGQIFYSATADAANPTATAAAELTEARQHFFLSKQFFDPFDRATRIDYDAHDLVMVETEDAAQNTMTALYDYRVLQPKQMTDPNGNRSEVRFNALGMVAGTAVMGKAAGPLEGDSFDDFATDLTPTQIKDYFDSANPRSLAIDHLGTATTRIIYDLDRVPACAASITRETHVSDLEQGQQTKVQLSFVYSDGLGREAQTKMQAEPGLLDPDDPVSTIDPRWVGTGATTYNNKGKPVRQYEPFFSSTHHFGIEQHGVSSTLFYDPVGRVVATLHPNHTWEKVDFDPWQQTTFDINDTVQNADGSTDPKSDKDVKGFFARLPDADYLPTWYEQRASLASNNPERIAADKAAVHRQTPTVAHLDQLGRVFLTITHNRFGIVEEKYPTRIALDIEGNEREVRDALGRIVMSYDYDMLGNRIHQESMEAGERWMLNDVTGKPIRAWDSRGFTRRITYDELRRPTGMFVTENDVERLAERSVYGESQGTTNNQRTRVFQIFDGAGMVTSEVYDFKGNLLNSKRDLLPDYKRDVDWKQNLSANDGTFTSITTFDALNRPITVTTPDQSVYRPTYNEANLLDKVEVNLRGAEENGELVWTPFVTNIDYNAKGQRTLIHYANGAETTYEYDDQTFRLVHLKTTRAQGANGLSQIFESPTIVQDLRYTYDPAGNITRIEDAALPTIFHNNEQIKPVCDYTYDAIYRLIEASGREHIGQAAFDFDPPGSLRDYPFVGSNANPNDLQALRNYTEKYEYDAVGNFEKLVHLAGANGNWTRSYAYNETSLIEPNKVSNRLSNTAIGQSNENYTYDEHGNMISMPHLTLMEWNFKDELRATSRQAVNNGTPETTYYVYDTTGQRVRKVTERQNGTRKCERIYLGGFEIYREHNGNGMTVTLERETLHVMDDKQRIALVETKTVENANPITSVSLQRYQLSNHLSSASVELDHNGSLISYEEYHPYGTTSYQAMTSAAEVSLKRYRYTNMERDEETSLNYHAARYYALWLGRWLAADPAELVDGPNQYAYGNNNPIRLKDASGTSVEGTIEQILAYSREALNLNKQSQALQQSIEVAEAGLKQATASYQEHSAMVSAGKDLGQYEPQAEKLLRNAQEEIADLERSLSVDRKQLTSLRTKIEDQYQKIVTAETKLEMADTDGGAPSAKIHDTSEVARRSRSMLTRAQARVESSLRVAANALKDIAAIGQIKPPKLGGGGPPPPPTAPPPAVPPGPKGIVGRISKGLGILNVGTNAYLFIRYGPKGVSQAVEDGFVLMVVLPLEIGKLIGEGAGRTVEEMSPGCAKTDSCPNRYMGRR